MNESPDELKTRIKKLNAQATQLKMDLHDLAEELPVGWEKIMDVAQRTRDAYAALADARRSQSG